MEQDWSRRENRKVDEWISREVEKEERVEVGREGIK